MNDRDCENCARNTPNNGCTSWSCDYINRKEAIAAWIEKHRNQGGKGQENKT